MGWTPTTGTNYLEETKIKKKIIKKLGPYLRKDDRKHFVVYYDDGTRGSVSYPKWLMEQHLGRQLEDWETVDHINNDKTDDRIENLQILSFSENAKKQAALKPAELYYFFCPCCGNGSVKRMNQVRGNWSKGKDGPYCSKNCAGKDKYVPVPQRVNNGVYSISKRNSSGEIGVRWAYYADKNLTYACASWRESGKDICKKFSVVKYGLLPAWKMAVECRRSVVPS